MDDVLKTSHMGRTLPRENFTSGGRRRAISLSMLKVAIVMSIIIELFFLSLKSTHTRRKFLRKLF